jgi:hypothetical protein
MKTLLLIAGLLLNSIAQAQAVHYDSVLNMRYIDATPNGFVNDSPKVSRLYASITTDNNTDSATVEYHVKILRNGTYITLFSGTVVVDSGYTDWDKTYAWLFNYVTALLKQTE